ncbi:MAG: alpha/beta hydrolase, partial [Chitinophagaceae bacterium]
ISTTFISIDATNLSLRSVKKRNFTQNKDYMQLAQKVAIGYMRAKINLIGVVSKKKAAKEAFVIFSTPFRKVKKTPPPIFGKSELIGFRLHHKKITGYRWNHPSSKKILILHGFESSAYNFERYIKPMIKLGYEVVAMDAPAHGKSEGKTINLLDYIETIAETEKRYGPFDAAMAHSFGGIAISMYLDKRKRKVPLRLVLIAPATETVTAIDSLFRFLQLNDGIRTEFNKLIHQKSGHWPSYFSINRVAPHLPANILWIHDEEDDMTPLADTEPTQKAQYPHIRFLITKGLGHRRIYRDNTVSRIILNFFNEDNSNDLKDSQDGF